ncbi:hypothetical protein JCGZ_03042 [Jatropha curcas]|uniref:F-box domain-containing protein n=1 Tax=Jatropha curcas TaxID=180498 RepID=A0A067JQS8_JATCU|nr:F-box/kelch-repeat protein At1g80440 [Jatropha curcas]KDP21904.1 hypothetical protein JCGZ_03042 [Jatropha curcas]
MTKSSDLIPGLPEEIALECLTRLHYSTYRVASRVSKRWRHLLRSREFYYQRKLSARTYKAACFIQSIPLQSDSKSTGSPSYGVSMLDPISGAWERVDPVPDYPDGLPLFCRVTSSEGKIVILGGWDPVSYEPLSHVFIYDFTTRKWRKGKNMPEYRSFFAVGELNGRVIIAGGHEENKNALSSAWVYDVTQDEWNELPKMSQERDECEGVVIGSEFWVVSGYKTDRQGQFESSAESIELGAREWKRVEDVWRGSGSPKSSCLGVDKGEILVSWSGPDMEVKVGTSGVQSGEWTIVSGSSYQGGPQEFYMMEGQNGKWKKLKVPDEFSGIVQSGCFWEI